MTGPDCIVIVHALRDQIKSKSEALPSIFGSDTEYYHAIEIFNEWA